MSILAALTGCMNNSQTANNSSPKNPGTCTQQPGEPLKTQNVKFISLQGKEETISGMASKDGQIGYSFEAKSGQALQYQTSDDICIWIYSPENKVLSDLKIPHNGKYLIQVSTSKGSTSFNLKIGLDVIQEEAGAPPNTEPTFSVTEEKDPEKFIQNHYNQLNNRNYKYTWTDLSLDFKSKIGSFSEYAEWWDSVDMIQVNSIKSISQDNSRATVDVDIQYKMKDGETRQDDKRRIHLEWNTEENHWDIMDKS